MSYELEISYNFLHLFPLRMSFRRAFRRITQRDKDGRLQVVGQLEEVAAPGGIEIADPARAQSLFGCGEANMLNGDSDVDVGMVFPIAPAFPRSGMVFAGDDAERGGLQPFALIARLYFLQIFFCRND